MKRSEPDAQRRGDRVLPQGAPLDAVLAAVGAPQADLDAPAQDDGRLSRHDIGVEHLEVVDGADLLAPPAAAVAQAGERAGLSEVAAE